MDEKAALRVVGSRLRDERLDKRLNQIDFGKLASVSENSQTAYEKGRTPPPVTYLLRLEQHGVDIGYVLTGRRSDGGFSAEQGLLFDLFGRLSAREREAVMQLMMTLAGQTVTTDQLDAQARRARQSLHDPGAAYKGANR